MAHFKINFINSIDIIFDSTIVEGRKVSDSSVKKMNGAEEAKTYDYYFVKKPNIYGIKWVIIKKGLWHGTDISATGKLPNYHRLEIIKMYK